ncbi:MAG: signal peptidase II [Lachnospiraceae bacterium]|nr:signal peptidase II [Lachnospiraceae bacterium]
MKTKKNSIYLLLSLAVIGILTALDQWTKYLAVAHLKGQPDILLIPGVLQLQYLENHGAAFGILQNQQWLFTALTLIFLAFALFALYRIPKEKPFMITFWVLTVLTAGALGNFIDRLVQKYVVDFVYFSLINFPIFNVADIYCTLSVAVFFILILFVYKEEQLTCLYHSIIPEKKKSQE